MASKQKMVYTNGLKALQKKMGTIFNNAKFSDMVFTVKNQKFYAFSQLVAMSSSSLDNLINTHFAHGVKEINLSNVKNVESFSVILQYMYGLDINFGELRLVVMCEVMDLAQTYNLDEFSEDVKQYLSKIETFEIDSLAALLNTSKKFNLNELYAKLTKFAFVISEEFVKHKTIVNLRYEVLLDLVKADWFYAREIEILKAVLTWHDDMKMKKSESSVEIGEVQHNNSEQSLDVSSETDTSDASTVEANEKEYNELVDMIEKEETVNQCKGIDNRDGKDKVESSDNKHKKNGKHVTSNPTDKFSAVVETFSNNVLKLLLVHIRVKQITMLDFVNLCEIRLFKQYKRVLRDGKVFSHSGEMRKKYVENDKGSYRDCLVGKNTNVTQYSSEELLALKDHLESCKQPDWNKDNVGSTDICIGGGRSSSQHFSNMASFTSLGGNNTNVLGKYIEKSSTSTSNNYSIRKTYSREQLLELKYHPQSSDLPGFLDWSLDCYIFGSGAETKQRRPDEECILNSGARKNSVVLRKPPKSIKKKVSTGNKKSQSSLEIEEWVTSGGASFVCKCWKSDCWCG